MGAMDCTGGGCGAMMAGGWIIGLLVIVLLVLAIVALIKYIGKK